MAVASTLAYDDMETIMTVKSLTVQAPGASHTIRCWSKFVYSFSTIDYFSGKK
jgi:hypothetical protein